MIPQYTMLGAYWAMMGAGHVPDGEHRPLLFFNMLIQRQQLRSARHKEYRGPNSYGLAMVALSSMIILK